MKADPVEAITKPDGGLAPIVVGCAALLLALLVAAAPTPRCCALPQHHCVKGADTLR